MSASLVGSEMCIRDRNDPGRGRQQDACAPQRLRCARQPRQRFLPMGVLGPGSGEEHGLRVGLGSANVPSNDCSKLARPPLDRRAQARQ
eukprot:11111929-Alexandrium_andersonii.AAC.1